MNQFCRLLKADKHAVSQGYVFQETCICPNYSNVFVPILGLQWGWCSEGGFCQVTEQRRRREEEISNLKSGRGSSFNSCTNISNPAASKFESREEKQTSAVNGETDLYQKVRWGRSGWGTLNQLLRVTTIVSVQLKATCATEQNSHNFCILHNRMLCEISLLSGF